MKCLVIAAGQGTRLRALAASKPLAMVHGAPLLEHILRRAKAGGASEFLVVTGYEAEGVEAALPALAAKLGVPVEAVRNPDWHRPNGLSVLAAAPRLKGEFVLLMSDHLFDPAILAALLAGRPREAALTLAADYDVANPLLDLDDATKLRVDADGRIAAIGKALDAYNAIDTGIFVASPPLLAAIEASVAAGGSGSLSEGVARLAGEGRAYAFDIGRRWWLDVDDEPAFRRAEAELLGPGAFPG
ncbi:MAG: NTP transferase domain-containing protein [Allosphingosinicella sp.]